MGVRNIENNSKSVNYISTKIIAEVLKQSPRKILHLSVDTHLFDLVFSITNSLF